MSKQYALIMSISFLVGTSLGYYFMAQLHAAIYSEAIPLAKWPVIITFILMISSILLTISSLMYRVIHENPATTLRNE